MKRLALQKETSNTSNEGKTTNIEAPSQPAAVISLKRKPLKQLDSLEQIEGKISRYWLLPVCFETGLLQQAIS
jgi:hypothetical protein